jgi:hypothetical protein
VLKDEVYRQHEFNRKNQVEFMGMKIYLVTAEDLIISKIIWIQELQSGIQKQDIKVLCKTAGLDWSYIKYWISMLNLDTFDLIEP